MKKICFALLSLTLIISACAPAPSPSQSVPQAVPEVSTTLPDNNPSVSAASDNSTAGQPTFAASITMDDNGRTFAYHVGDSFLLNLGADVYDWEVTVADQNIFQMKMGVMVIQGAQGIYEALARGSTTLTAVGSPKCLQSTPPCGMPTILFKVTLTVE